MQHTTVRTSAQWRCRIAQSWCVTVAQHERHITRVRTYVLIGVLKRVLRCAVSSMDVQYSGYKQAAGDAVERVTLADITPEIFFE
jgi:hypothetical protein